MDSSIFDIGIGPERRMDSTTRKSKYTQVNLESKPSNLQPILYVDVFASTFSYLFSICTESPFWIKICDKCKKTLTIYIIPFITDPPINRAQLCSPVQWPSIRCIKGEQSTQVWSASLCVLELSDIFGTLLSLCHLFLYIYMYIYI